MTPLQKVRALQKAQEHLDKLNAIVTETVRGKKVGSEYTDAFAALDNAILQHLKAFADEHDRLVVKFMAIDRQLHPKKYSRKTVDATVE